MSSTQEAEQFIQSLSSYSILRRNHVEKSSKRLLFELLRYINGKTFATAKAVKATPFLTLKVYPGAIIAECNSDDLTKEDMHAICQPVDTEQNKAANFKTIVAATKRTHIESGNLSVEFQRSIFDLDNSLTMRRVWITPAQTVSTSTTRITLYLHDQGSKAEIQNLRNIIVSQFEDLEQESILFLGNIQSLKVEFREDDKMLRSRHFEKQTIDKYRVSVKTTTVDLEHNVIGANLILAFPLTDDFKVEVGSISTKVLNLLPLAQGSLGFHIHSLLEVDDTTGVIVMSTHNIGIQNEIANVFFKAILQFCEHSILRYYWPLFIKNKPTEEDPFWGHLRIDVLNWISQNPVLVSRHVKQWRLISHLASPGRVAQDKAGNPLLDDEINDPFLSNRYPPGVIDILKYHGLATLSTAQFIDLLEIHFSNPSLRSRMMGQPFKLQDSFARLLSKLLANDEYANRIKSLPLLPTQGGIMVSAASGLVYTFRAGSPDIPRTLGLKLINESDNLAYFHKSLYRQLGVVEASVPQVRDLILQKFSTSKCSLDLDSIKDCLVYLYLTHLSHDPKHEREYQTVQVMTKSGQIVTPWRTAVYWPGKGHRYTPESLLSTMSHVAKCPISILHPGILGGDPKPKYIQAYHPNWMSWLELCLGTKTRLSLIQPNPLLEQESDTGGSSTFSKANVLSEQCKHVLENCPDRFLGLIQHLWQDDGPHITKSPSLLSEIQQLPAKDLCGVSRPVKLRQTWFPLPHLQDIAKTYLEYPSEFPFLKIEEEKNMTVTVTTKWGFLTEYLGVKDKNSLEFLLQLLECIKHSWDRESIWQMQKIFELYSTIRKQFSTSSREEKKRAQEFFEASGILYMDETGPIWTGTSSCLWAAPPDMICRYSLKMFYEDKVVNTSALQGIRGLFCDALGIQNATAEDVVEEMCLLRDEGCEDLARITNNYAYLDNSIESSCSIRAAFGEQAVIFIQHDDISTWFSVKECSWSETETTPMECSLKRCYPGFKNFFLEKLGVRTSSYDKLVDFTSTDVEEAKKCLLSFMDESDALYEYDPELMAKVKIFPVQYPTSEAQPRPSIELCSLDTEFCIGDRDYLVKSLQSKVKMLSFSITEIRRLQPLFFWLSMEDRYLSECVEEMITGIPSSNFMPGDATAIEMALMNKAYQIARVAETFNSYGPYGNALSLYNMLRKLKVAKVDNMSIDLLLYQDDEVFTSRSSQKTIAYISEHIDSMAIYVNYDDNNEKLCLFSTLPRKLQQWLMQDLGSLCFEPFEVTNALTSIFACDVGILDDILDDQGMAQLSFENLDKVQSEPYTGAQQPRVDQDKALTLPVRER
ncbi:hypothetical protein FPSE_06898 [Fusarium pseudograminearum CS3096]|uniref:Uncharacterized protein n=1 Tax=Fusarium pseudograminearum (strain CS3096) TaxID=1028729 RepID=K3VFD5_FUSPC|nr:hypothetical protein FPSE_06898 [Fusarium pseudograminearum CS3096]EKJ72852.1 hypothetical protein FPSE_06898 [Fusarium pseudograminearum CS3096]